MDTDKEFKLLHETLVILKNNYLNGEFQQGFFHLGILYERLDKICRDIDFLEKNAYKNDPLIP